MTQNIFVVTGLSDESIAMCLFCVMCFFFSVTLTVMLSCCFFSFHYLHCGVIDTVCLISAIHVFIKGKIGFVWLLEAKMMHIFTHITAGNIAFPAHYILLF